MNMHVSPEGVDFGTSGPWGPAEVSRMLQGVLAEVTDAQVEQQRPGNRAWMLGQLRLVLEVAADASPEDPRFLKIRLDALDRIGKILRVAELQGAREREGDVDRQRLVAAATAALEALESKSRG